MKKNKRLMIVSLIISLIVNIFAISTGAAAAGAGGATDSGEYTVLVKFFDDVMLRYTVIYPAGGIWTGYADIPLGGTEASSQVYCVDPFVPFHSKAETSYPAGVTTDKVIGYDVAAPWTVSAQMLANNDAVRWLVYNGYRGDYLKHDEESVTSVARLQEFFGENTSVVINKKLALMATKIAIWKVLAGDSVKILEANVTPAQREALDWLVDYLVDNAQQSDGSDIYATDLKLEITGKNADARDTLEDYSGVIGEDYLCFGPYSVITTLINPGADSDDIRIENVFLCLSGDDSSKALLASDTAGTPLLSGVLYGAAVERQYLGGGYILNKEWISDDFYILVPAARIDALDRLTVHAMAKAPKAPLLPGTPITYVYSKGGVHDWNHVQAYAGAARESIEADLYAHDRFTPENTPLRGITIAKRVANGAPGDSDLPFSFKLEYLADGGGGGTFKTVQLRDYRVIGGTSVSPDGIFTLKDGQQLYVGDLPAHWHYRVTEIGADTDDFDTSFEVENAAAGDDHMDTGYVTLPFQLDDNGGNDAIVTFTNTHKHGNIRFYIGKAALNVGIDGPKVYIDKPAPYEFRIEKSLDDGINWAPVDLSGAEFESDGKAVRALNPSGRFSLYASDMAYIGVDITDGPGVLYRIVENKPDPEFKAGYAVLLLTDGDVRDAFSDGLDYAPDDYMTQGFSLESGDTCYAVFSNVRFDFKNLTLGKRLAGDYAPDDAERRFPFQIYFMSDIYDDVAASMAIPLTSAQTAAEAESEHAFMVTGVGADRITKDGAQNPTILWLKHGETVVVEGLPQGDYEVRELVELYDDGGYYDVSHRVGDKPANDSAIAALTLLEDIRVLFTNTKKDDPEEAEPTPSPSPTPSPEQTPDPSPSPGPSATPSPRPSPSSAARVTPEPPPPSPKVTPGKSPSPSPTASAALKRTASPKPPSKRTPRPSAETPGGNPPDAPEPNIPPGSPEYEIDPSRLPGDVISVDRPPDEAPEPARVPDGPVITPKPRYDEEAPQTGDPHSPAASLALLALGGTCAAGASVYGKRNRAERRRD